jgi:hypothetical protein
MTSIIRIIETPLPVRSAEQLAKDKEEGKKYYYGKQISECKVTDERGEEYTVRYIHYISHYSQNKTYTDKYPK